MLAWLTQHHIENRSKREQRKDTPPSNQGQKKNEPLRRTALINKLSIVFISSLPMSPLSAATDCGAALHYSSGELFETSGVVVFLLKAISQEKYCSH